MKNRLMQGMTTPKKKKEVVPPLPLLSELKKPKNEISAAVRARFEIACARIDAAIESEKTFQRELEQKKDGKK